MSSNAGADSTGEKKRSRDGGGASTGAPSSSAAAAARREEAVEDEDMGRILAAISAQSSMRSLTSVYSRYLPALH